MGFPAITLPRFTLVKQTATSLPDAPEAAEIPELTQLDELETFVGSKQTKSGYGLP